jgi:parafibromin
MSVSGVSPDPLLLLRNAVTAGKEPVPVSSEATPSPDVQPVPLAQATHLYFPNEPNVAPIPLNSPTRFLSSGSPVDLRSILFAYHSRELQVQPYIAATQQLNEELKAAGGAGGSVQNLIFVEKVDLISWLEGGDSSEFIQPLEGEAAKAADAAGRDLASSRADGAAKGLRAGEIESWGERRLSDRNIILRGIKPTVSDTLKM